MKKNIENTGKKSIKRKKTKIVSLFLVIGQAPGQANVSGGIGEFHSMHVVVLSFNLSSPNQIFYFVIRITAPERHAVITYLFF